MRMHSLLMAFLLFCAGLAHCAAPAWEDPWQGQTGVTVPTGKWPAYPATTPRTYAGDHLQYVQMPIGGIGSGTVWLDGQGRFFAWQIDNKYTESLDPHSLFAIRAQIPGQPAQTRALQTVAAGGLTPFPSLTYEGGYPIARLQFADPAFPLTVRLEAFNPLIPTDAADSSLPCLIVRVTARNAGTTAVRAQCLGTLDNLIGTTIPEVPNITFAGNRNDLLRETGLIAAFLRQDPLSVSGALGVRGADGRLVTSRPLLYVDRLGSLPEMTAQGGYAFGLLRAIARYGRDGGAVLLGEATPDFCRSLADARRKMEDIGKLEVFEDFEKPTYEGWTVVGDAFGKKPQTGGSPNQQFVSGFLGNGLVNTYLNSDNPQGELISKPFTITKNYIGMLIGGGNHPGTTCVNLEIDGKVVCTATGKTQELLEPASWDVTRYKGQQATIRIVDHESGGWGHINVDHIVFSESQPDALMRFFPLQAILSQMTLPLATAEGATIPAAPAKTSDAALREPWLVSRYTKLPALGGDSPYRALATAPNGDPLIITGPLDKGTIVLCLAPNLPASWRDRLLEIARGAKTAPGERIVSLSPTAGSQVLASPDSGSAAASWSELAKTTAAFAADGTLPTGENQPGRQGAALTIPLDIPAGQERTATFVITWHFPNVQRYEHPGNMYSRRFSDALAVTRYVQRNLPGLSARTELYHDTMYQSNLPEEWLDAITSQSVIARGPTCWWAEDGYFAGYEGAYGCCPLNCTHVWNYAQSHARLFPQIGRIMRQSDLEVYLHKDGETSHRQHTQTGAFVDGQCATIVETYREYQLSTDTKFLTSVWPEVKRALDWMIVRFDPDHDGILAGHQANTYDCSVSGANTFIGSQYLAALAAGERMAQIMQDPDTAARWNAIRKAGMDNQNTKLWNGEYYIQIPGASPANDYNTGCHSDQLLGQWWAHQLGLGYLYPPDRVRSSMSAVMKYNYRENMVGFQQLPRRYLLDNEGGLLICTWPNGGRPKSFTIYSDEVWTGIEYAAAGEMISAGLIDEARKVVKTARSRYDGIKRDGVNSGPGGNPFCELECGRFYARAMSSWGLLIAAQGLVLDGPAGILGFQPKWQPEDHRSFFTAPEAWGLFIQSRQGRQQRERIEVRHGQLTLRELVFAAPTGVKITRAAVTIGGKTVSAALTQQGEEIRLKLPAAQTVLEGKAVEVNMSW